MRGLCTSFSGKGALTRLIQTGALLPQGLRTEGETEEEKERIRTAGRSECAAGADVADGGSSPRRRRVDPRWTTLFL